jgi:Ion transport protein
MIYPEDKRKIYWDCISSAAVIYAVAEIPFSIGFLGDEVMPIIIVALDDILVIVFWIEIVLSFNCAYVDAKTRLVVTDRKQIAIRYCKFWFWFDLVSAAPLRQIATYYNTTEFSSNNYSFQLVRLFRLSRLVFVYKLFKSERLSTHLDSINVFPQVKNSCLLFLQIFLTAHVLACFWFFITTRKCTGIQNPEDDLMKPLIITWATTFGFQNADIFSQYIASLYFTFETLFTIGYGDFYATNMGERVYVIVVMLIGSLLFGAIIAQIKDVLDSLNIQKTEAIKKLEEFSEFMEEKRYPLELRVRAKEAYSYYLDRRPSLSEKGLFDMLPRALKIKVLNLKYRREIMSIDFFQSTDIAFAVKLLSHSRPYSVKYGQCIYGIGDVANELSFLIRGSVRITAPSIVSTKGKKDENGTDKILGGSSTFGYATSGGYFGDFEYSKSGLRNAQYTAGQSCICISVSYLVVSEAIKDCPVAGATFLAQIKERSALYSSQKARKLTIPTPIKGLTLSPVSSKADLHSPNSETIQSSESRPRSFTRVRNRSDSIRKSSRCVNKL